MITKVQKWGNSLAVRIPRSTARDTHLGLGAEVDVVSEDGRIVMAPVRLKRIRLDDLLKGLTGDKECDGATPVAAYCPKRGDLVWLGPEVQEGEGETGRRAALVITPISYHRKCGRALCCLVVSRATGGPFETEIPAGCGVPGAVAADLVERVDWRTLPISFGGELPDEAVKEVLHKLAALTAM